MSCRRSRRRGTDRTIDNRWGLRRWYIRIRKREWLHGYQTNEERYEKSLLGVLPFVTGDVLITFSPDGNSIPELIPDSRFQDE